MEFLKIVNSLQWDDESNAKLSSKKDYYFPKGHSDFAWASILYLDITFIAHGCSN